MTDTIIKTSDCVSDSISLIGSEIGYDTVVFSFDLPIKKSYEVASLLRAPKVYSRYNEAAADLLYNNGELVGKQARITRTKSRNVDVTIYHDNGRVLISGSVPRYLKGNNFHLAQANEILLFADKLAQALGLSIDTILKSRIIRIDITSNLLMAHKVESYLHTMGDVKGLYRHKDYRPLTTIYWCNSKKHTDRASDVLCAYDKICETLNKKHEIPQEYQGRNVLRIEERLKTQSIKRIFYNGITLEQLGEETNFKVLKNKLCSTMKNIDILSVPGSEIFERPEIDGPAIFTNVYVKCAFTYFNSEVISFETALNMSNLSGKQKTGARRKRKRFEIRITSNGVANELRDKIASL